MAEARQKFGLDITEDKGNDDDDSAGTRSRKQAAMGKRARAASDEER